MTAGRASSARSPAVTMHQYARRGIRRLLSRLGGSRLGGSLAPRE